MKLTTKTLAALSACITLGAAGAWAETVTNPQAVQAMLNRIGGNGAAAKIETVIDTELGNGKETFSIATSADGRPRITGSTMSALTTGINWYLNHTARVNLTWNRPTTTFGALPAPATEETHATSAIYRYYLNYCTFSYSMSTWTWERWEQEIDYMALHGINMPLQIIGLDVVWRNMLTQDYGYSKAEADAFIAGPCFQAWWGMNNLEGWGGKNPDWWYERQEQLAGKILNRMRELGIEPVLPGFCGMVPSNFEAKTGMKAIGQGNWCGFQRPYILNPESDAFQTVAATYYKRLAELMGTSDYYSMDPFHEGANTSGIASIDNAYRAIYEAMEKARPTDSKWVIQQWQWSGQQYKVLDNVPKGRLVVLDLFSDGKPGNLNSYKGHDVIYCALPNFGGRTGIMGRFNTLINGYFNYTRNNSAIKGVGATPEAIEQVPVIYDLLFELPWHATKPVGKEWMADYARARYGLKSEQAEAAWELMRASVLNCTSALQGPHEAVMCGRPAWNVDRVSTWGSSEIFYNTDLLCQAAYSLLDANLSGENYSYDLTDVVRQAMSDYSKSLLKGIADIRTDQSKTDIFAARKATFLQLILDTDRLLGTNSNFRLGRWTQMARGIADEVAGTTTADKEWLELNNARTIISTWGARGNAEGGGLHDYSYRQWNGMLKDYYYARWQMFFNGQSPNWFDWEHAWAMNASLSYDATPQGDTRAIATELMDKYIIPVADTYAYRALVTDVTSRVEPTVIYRGEAIVTPVKAAASLQGEFTLSFGSTSVKGLSGTMPADAEMGDFTAVASLPDGTAISFPVSVRDRVVAPFTVQVRTADPAQGTVSIDGTDADRITTSTTEGVTVRAIPAAGARFERWLANGEPVSTANPYTYYGNTDVELTAEFSQAPMLTAGDVTFRYELDPAGDIIITAVESGHGHADLTAAITGNKKIVGIAHGALQGCDAITAITIPATCVALDGLALNAEVKGDGTQNRVITLNSPLRKGTSWIITLKATSNGASFNQWGSGLLATGTDALAATYNGGCQLYLAKAGTITIKTQSAENRDLTNPVGAEFTLTANYDAASKTLAFRLVNAEGKVQTTQRTGYELDDITSLVTALPEGINITSLQAMTFDSAMRPFAGCTSLTHIHVQPGHPLYTSMDGVMLSADGSTLCAYPEGRFFIHGFRLLADNGHTLYANPGANADGEVIDRTRGVLAAEHSALQANSLWRLTPGNEQLKVEHLNSHRFFGGKDGAHDRIELPVSPTQYHGEYTYSWEADGTDCRLSLRLANGMYAAWSENYIKLGSEAASFLLKEADAIESTADFAAVTYPVDVLAPANAYMVTGLDNDMLITTHIDEGSVIPAGTGFLLKGKASLAVSHPADHAATQAAEVQNYLSGTTVDRTGLTPNSFFVLDPDTETFRLTDGSNVDANSAYLTVSAFGNPIAATTLKIDVSDKTSILDTFADSSAKGRARMFDLQGRPASEHPAPGIYVLSNGEKTIVQ